MDREQDAQLELGERERRDSDARYEVMGWCWVKGICPTGREEESGMRKWKKGSF